VFHGGTVIITIIGFINGRKNIGEAMDIGGILLGLASLKRP
jgi:hypothetical protein